MQKSAAPHGNRYRFVDLVRQVSPEIKHPMMPCGKRMKYFARMPAFGPDNRSRATKIRHFLQTKNTSVFISIS
jgi:hypothetical protein